MKNKLKYIYKANQCTDLSDVDNALLELRRLANGDWTPRLTNRLISLENKRSKIIFKNQTGLSYDNLIKD